MTGLAKERVAWLMKRTASLLIIRGRLQERIRGRIRGRMRRVARLRRLAKVWMASSVKAMPGAAGM